MADDKPLPERVTHVKVGDKDIYLVGTAHLSKESVLDVRAAVEQVQPETICVELCKSRHQALTQADSWRRMDIFKIIREKKAVFLLAQLILTSFYRRLGEKLGVQPGAEMIEGIDLAEKTGAELVLADRDIDITLKRVWGHLSFWNKFKLLMHLMAGIFVPEQIDAEMIESLKQRDLLESAMAEFADKFPQVKERLIDERDIFLAQKIRTAPGQKIVAVVGAGHVAGITPLIQEDHTLDALMELPPKSIWPKIVGWGLPILILVLLVLGFRAGTDEGMKNVFIWILSTSVLTAIGTAMAFGHPLAILSAAMVAPLTPFHPLISSGMIGGLVQAYIKRPKVRDLEDLSDAITSVRGFWMNAATRVLLVFALANLGTFVGTLVAGFWVAARSA
jgi:pheromone shutdown-related protein TraB